MTAIEWTDVTWNPVRGCSRVSPGCENCYAERQAARPILSAPGKPYHGLVTVRSQASGLRYESPGAAGSWTAPRWTGKVVLDYETLAAPLRWKKPRRVFVNSMSDLFHESLTDEQIAAVFGVMAATPQHTYQLLTKRPERAADWFRWISRRSSDAHSYPVGFVVGLASQFLFMPSTDFMPELTVQWPVWPLRNVWLGVSVEDQQRADERIPYLLRCPAAVRFLSVEPMIGPVDVSPWLRRTFGCPSCGNSWISAVMCGDCNRGSVARPHVDWVIVGGESGPGARPCNVEWIRSIVAQCRAAGVPVFVKQLGSVAGNYLPRDDGDRPDFFREPYRDRKGGDPSEWPEDLRVREWPEVKP